MKDFARKSTGVEKYRVEQKEQFSTKLLPFYFFHVFLMNFSLSFVLIRQLNKASFKHMKWRQLDYRKEISLTSTSDYAENRMATLLRLAKISVCSKTAIIFLVVKD